MKFSREGELKDFGLSSPSLLNLLLRISLRVERGTEGVSGYLRDLCCFSSQKRSVAVVILNSGHQSKAPYQLNFRSLNLADKA
jgi:hypothetical protein